MVQDAFLYCKFFIEEKKITNAVGHPVKIVKRNEIHERKIAEVE